MRLFNAYYAQTDVGKASTFRHEFYHIRQEVEYGVGGCWTKYDIAYNSSNAPAMFGYTQEQVRNAILSYGVGGDGGDVNLLEIEAVLKGGQDGTDFGATYSTPIF